MSRRDVVQSHMETLMERLLETDELRVNEAGAVPVSHGSAIYTVRVIGVDRSPHVEVYAVAVDDIDSDPGLYEALNVLNRRLAHARAFWEDRKVVLAATLLGAALELDELECTCDEIAVLAHREGPRLAKTFGGRVARPDEVEEEVEEL